MLTNEQKERRTRGIGASEVSAIADCNPFQTATDVWLRKHRGQDLELPPVVAPSDDDTDIEKPLGLNGLSIDPRVCGSILEDGIVEIYRHVVQPVKIEESDTCAHHAFKFELATPDRIVFHKDNTLTGLEIKLVGKHTSYHWTSHTLPDYVLLQCQWCMRVTGISQWDVCALVNGSSGLLFRLEYDEELTNELHELVSKFWYNYVLANVPPPSSGIEIIKRLTRQYPEPDKNIIEVSKEDFIECAERLNAANRALKEAEKRRDEELAKLYELSGPHKGISCDAGQFTWTLCQGRPSYRAIAHELARGPIPEDLLDKHRGEPYRLHKLKLKKKES